MEITFTGQMWHWRGPSPHHFVSLPAEESATVYEVAGLFSYGWGAIPVTARIGATTFTTSIFPKDGHYIVPVKKAVRVAERVELGDDVPIHLALVMP